MCFKILIRKYIGLKFEVKKTHGHSHAKYRKSGNFLRRLVFANPSHKAID